MILLGIMKKSKFRSVFEPMKKNVFALMLALCLLLTMPVFAEEASSALPEGEIRELPMDIDKGGSKPLLDHYIYQEGNGDPVGYEDASIRVMLETNEQVTVRVDSHDVTYWVSGRYENTDYWTARIQIAHPSQLRTAFASRYNSQQTEYVTALGKRFNAVFAMTGDSYISDKLPKRLVIRQGTEYRNKLTGNYDVLVIDDQADLHILQMPTAADITAYEGNIVNALTFGPGLIIDGVPQADRITEISKTSAGRDFTDQVAAFKSAQRIVLAQTGPLEYLVIATAGPEDKGNTGLSLIQLIDLLQTRYPEIQNAYNLDGGTSSWMVFRTEASAYSKINVPTNPKLRSVSDIIYFASAIVEE